MLSTTAIKPRAASSEGALIINADDWGRDRETTDRTLECVLLGSVSSVSAMVFTEDSERAAAVARERGIDAGLHLNLTTPFSGSNVPSRLVDRHQEVISYLRRRYASAIYHPGLAGSFEYVVKAQINEYHRLYGAEPARLDGHHHMHLSANVLLANLLPAGTIARRNFSFRAGEKSFCNRLFRRLVDSRLAVRHRLTDYFFSLPPLEPASRLETIFALASQHIVEVETHPVNPEEHRFLTGGGIFRIAKDHPIAAHFSVPVNCVSA